MGASASSFSEPDDYVAIAFLAVLGFLDLAGSVCYVAIRRSHGKEPAEENAKTRKAMGILRKVLPPSLGLNVGCALHLVERAFPHSRVAITITALLLGTLLSSLLTHFI